MESVRKEMINDTRSQFEYVPGLISRPTKNSIAGVGVDFSSKSSSRSHPRALVKHNINKKSLKDIGKHTGLE